MEVKTISIDWNNDFFNNALLVIHVNKLPQNLYIYEQKENIYFIYVKKKIPFFWLLSYINNIEYVKEYIIP